MRVLTILALGLASVFLLPAGAAAGGSGDFDHTYASLDTMLRANVDARGMVNYGAVAQDPTLDAFIAKVGAVPAEEVGGWSRDAQIAFYTNAYNAITIKAILDGGTPKSIRDIKPDVWDNKRWTVAGRTVSLNWIEHTKLRKTLNEPRVHFTLVCAAKGCPKLRNRAFTSAAIGREMDAAAKVFFTDAGKNRYDAASKTVYLSKILDWYGDDFVGYKGLPEVAGIDGLTAKQQAGIRLFAKYAGVDPAGATGVVYNDYDWSLNKQ